MCVSLVVRILLLQFPLGPAAKSGRIRGGDLWENGWRQLGFVTHLSVWQWWLLKYNCYPSVFRLCPGVCPDHWAPWSVWFMLITQARVLVATECKPPPNFPLLLESFREFWSEVTAPISTPLPFLPCLLHSPTLRYCDAQISQMCLYVRLSFFY